MFVYNIYIHTIYIYISAYICIQFARNVALQGRSVLPLPPLGSSVPDTNLAEAQRKAQEAGKIRIRKMRALSVSLADR